MKKLIFPAFALVAVVIATIVVSAENHTSRDSSYLEQFRGRTPSEIVPKVWLAICALNHAQYPDSNLIQPGDVLRLPLDKRYTVAEYPRGFSDHMWRAAVAFTDKVVMPYLNHPRAVVSASANTPEAAKTDSSLIWFLVLIVIAIIFLVVALRLTYQYFPDRKHPFIARQNIPDFNQATNEEVAETAGNALRQVYGRNFEIVGPIERGVMNGTMIILFANGSLRREKFRDEAGFRARLRFNDGHEELVVSRWSCFNPCWTAQDARFSGTFTPDGETPQRIERIMPEELAELTENVRRSNRGEEPATDPIPPKEPEKGPESESPQKETPPTLDGNAEGGKMGFTEVMISEGRGLTLKGKFSLSVEELKGLITSIKTEGKEK